MGTAKQARANRFRVPPHPPKPTSSVMPTYSTPVWRLPARGSKYVIGVDLADLTNAPGVIIRMCDIESIKPYGRDPQPVYCYTHNCDFTTAGPLFGISYCPKGSAQQVRPVETDDYAQDR